MWNTRPLCRTLLLNPRRGDGGFTRPNAANVSQSTSTVPDDAPLPEAALELVGAFRPARALGLFEADLGRTLAEPRAGQAARVLQRGLVGSRVDSRAHA